MTTSTKNIPSFNKSAAAIIKATEAFDGAGVKFAAAVVIAVQTFLDACSVAGVARDQAGSEAVKLAIADNEMMYKAWFYDSTLQKTTVTEYAQSAKRAYFHNVPFTQALKNNPAFKVPDANGKVKGGKVSTDTAKSAKSGKVSKTTVPALVETLRKALEQAKLLNLDLVHAILIDAACEIDPDFKV